MEVSEEVPKGTRVPPRAFIKEAERHMGDTYQLDHPSGRFSISVRGETRRDTFIARGYRLAGEAEPSMAPGGANRAALIARAKELGIPAKGTNEALTAAIAEAEG